jgi:UDP-galactopyranose mutase
MRPVVIAGAGLSGAVIARELAEAGQDVTVYEARDHVAGNCYTERDAQTGVLVHRYGPHIFHTGDEEVWDYVQRFARFRSYTHRVRTTAEGRVYALPVNLGTINQFYDGTLSPAQAQGFISAIAEDIDSPRNFEEQALSMVGRDLYETFFKGYTQKQWGVSPRALPASILKRLPLRFSYEDSYFNHPIQAQPEAGYTPMVQAMLDHARITLLLNTPLDPGDVPDAAHIFWSGPLDAYFGYALGRLGYRTLDFEHERRMGDAQGCPVMNYGDPDVPYTRITEHKHFAPWEHHDQTVITREYSHACGPQDIPYYPIRLVQDKALLSEYINAAKAQRGTTFVGRLGTYRYLDMDVCIREALDTAQAYLAAKRQLTPLPAFMQDPL